MASVDDRRMQLDRHQLLLLQWRRRRDTAGQRRQQNSHANAALAAAAAAAEASTARIADCLLTGCVSPAAVNACTTSSASCTRRWPGPRSFTCACGGGGDNTAGQRGACSLSRCSSAHGHKLMHAAPWPACINTCTCKYNTCMSLGSSDMCSRPTSCSRSGRPSSSFCTYRQNTHACAGGGMLPARARLWHACDALQCARRRAQARMQQRPRSACMRRGSTRLRRQRSERVARRLPVGVAVQLQHQQRHMQLCRVDEDGGMQALCLCVCRAKHLHQGMSSAKMVQQPPALPADPAWQCKQACGCRNRCTCCSCCCCPCYRRATFCLNSASRAATSAFAVGSDRKCV